MIGEQTFLREGEMSMNRAKSIQITIGVICLLLCTYVQAQQMYRCGKVFQDRPCDGSQQINTPPAATGTAQNSVRAPTDLECARRGEEAQRIVWAKEAGRTEEMQLASANPGQRQLISNVYRRRGTSGELRAAIEADCVAEKERAAQAAALISAGSKMLEQGKSAPPSSPNGPSYGDQSAGARSKPMVASDAQKKSNCSKLSARLVEIRNTQRGGLSAAAMDNLNREYAETDKARRDAGC